MFLLGLCGFAYAQNIQIKGTVTSATDSYPIIGASVVDKADKTNGTITDIDGNFTLTVKPGSEITFSYIGYKTLTLKAETSMSVIMHEDSEMLQEVVVTGYTTQRKADLTGSISVVSMDEIAKQNENNPMKAMQGRVPGMNITADGNPSGSTTIRIRGIGTLNNNDPLYIIDGVPTKGGMHELNGNDIESIQVLKDAASASIYGSRAANGVIIITTKKGKEGQLKINFDASVSASMYTNKLEVLNTEEYGRAMWQAYVNEGQDPNTNNLGYLYDWNYGVNGYPQLNGISMRKYLDAANTVPAADTDWFDQTTRTGIIQQYNVSVSNGSEKGSSFFSLGYYKNLGIIKDTDFDRISARMNADYKLIDNLLTVGEHFTVNRTSEVQAPGGFLQNVLQANPSLPVYTTEGKFAGPVSGYPDRENPVARLQRNADNRYTYWRMFGDAYINLNPFKNFNLRSTFGIDYSQKQQRIFTYPITEGNVANDKNAIEAKQEHWTKWMWNAIATYNMEVGKHRGDVMLGMELNREDDIHFSGYKENFSILTPDYMWPDAGVGTAQSYGAGEGYSLVSFFGKLNYTYNDKYLLSLTVRRDGSSRFGKNNRWGTFPSVSLAWRVSQEDWFPKDNSLMNDLKLRVGYGVTGNQEIGNYGFVASYNTGVYPFGNNNSTALVSTTLSNPNIHWEEVRQTNFGVDMSLFDSRVSLSLDAYIKNTNDMLVKASIPITSGFEDTTETFTNAGKMRNKGVEMTLRTINLKGIFSWESALTATYNKNEILDLNSETPMFINQIGNSYVTMLKAGYPINVFYGYVTDGLFQNWGEVNRHATQPGAAPGDIRFRDLNNDGVINDEDRTILGNPNPNWFFSLSNNLSYKGWELSVFLQGVAGNKIYNANNVDNEGMAAAYNQTTAVLNRWTGEGTSYSMPRAIWGDPNQNCRVSDRFVENGSYLRLKNITLSYTLPKKWLQKIQLENARISFSCENVATITGYSGFDPEVDVNGIDSSRYPISRTFSMGLNFNF